MSIGVHTPVRHRYNSRQTGVVEESVIQTRGCGRGIDACIRVRWSDGTITEVGEGDLVPLTIPPSPGVPDGMMEESG